MTAHTMTAYVAIGIFADEDTIVAVGTTKQEALDLADELHTEIHDEWDTDAEREEWLDSLAILELRGDLTVLRRFASITQSETTFGPKVARTLHPHIHPGALTP